jgi:hypothetical protein
MKKQRKKRNEYPVQEHRQCLAKLAQTAHNAVYSPATHPDPNSTWASSPDGTEQGWVGGGRFGSLFTP